MVKPKRFIIGLILVLCFSLFFNAAARGQTDTSANPQQALIDISNEEKAILEELFIISQEIDEMNKSSILLLEELSTLQEKIPELEASISKRQQTFDTKLEVLKNVLLMYQKNGPASSLEILLSAESLSDFLKRFSILNELSHNTEEILLALEEDKSILVSEKDALIQDRASLEEKSEALQLAILQKLQLQQNQQAVLDSLSDEKANYQNYLNQLEQSWDNVKVLFSNTTQELTRVIYESDLTFSDFNLSLNLFSVKGSVSDALINETIEKDGKIPRMIFTFTSQIIQLEIPDYHLLLRGSMAIEGECSFKYTVEEGTFYGVRLEKHAIEDLFSEGYLILDFTNIMGGVVTLKSVDIKDGFIEFKTNQFF